VQTTTTTDKMEQHAGMKTPKRPLTGKVALVTGASRGVGKGIAVQLGEAGCMVYITGRTAKPTGSSLGSLVETSDEIKRRGGKCIYIKCDHENDHQVSEVFAQIGRETNNRLDILVNCAFKGGNTIFSHNMEHGFWDLKPEIWDDINNVGLRNNYICSVYAARMMVPAKQGLIINISSVGGMRYMFNVPYGVGKAAVDRLSADCGVELRNSNITVLSLYPGIVKTEFAAELLKNQGHLKVSLKGPLGCQVKMSDFFKNAESPEFTGKVVVSLAQDPKLMTYSSNIVVAADYAQSHGIKDIDDRSIASYRQLNYYASLVLPERFQYLAKFIPGFVKIPHFVLSSFDAKF